MQFLLFKLNSLIIKVLKSFDFESQLNTITDTKTLLKYREFLANVRDVLIKKQSKYSDDIVYIDAMQDVITARIKTLNPIKQ